LGRQPTHPVKEEGVVPKLMRLYPNLYGDLSDDSPRNALARDPDYGPKFLTEFQDRLFFGTDLCFPDMPIKIIDLLRDWRASGKITEEVFQKVARENAIRFFDL
jgi:predicted TIM-barrel fold metal-dependent hydrolase